MTSSKKTEHRLQPNPIQTEYKYHYNKELNRKNELNNAIDRPIGIITLYSAVMYYLFKNITPSPTYLVVFQVSMLIVALLFLSYAIVLLIQVYLGHEYRVHATPNENEKYHKELLDYHDGDDKAAKAELLDSIYDSYAKAATMNAKVNEYRANKLYKATKTIIWIIPIIVIAGLVQIAQNSSVF